MAKKKKSTPAKRRTSTRKAKRSGGRRRGSVKMAGFGPMLADVAIGVAGAVIASKVAPVIPIGSNKVKFGLLTVGGALLARKPGPLRALGVGMSIASGTLLAQEFMPNLLATKPPATVGRVSPETVKRMLAAAQDVRTRGTALVNGDRDRTIVGDGGRMSGTRNRTVVGDGGSPKFDDFGLSY